MGTLVQVRQQQVIVSNVQLSLKDTGCKRVVVDCVRDDLEEVFTVFL